MQTIKQSIFLLFLFNIWGVLLAQNDLPSQERVAEKMRISDSLRALPPKTGGFITLATSPNSDCGNAIPICQQSYTQNTSYDDYGFLQELSTTCLLNDEQKTVWYTFTAQTSGTFGFTVNTLYDYDFAMYDITGTNCGAIPSMTPLRCNFSATYGNTGLNAASPAGGNLSYGAGQSPIMPGINVTAGNTYVLVLDNFTRDLTGYSITFTGTASIFDNVGPILTAGTINCSATSNQILVTFNEPVKCTELIAANFSITGGSPASIPVTAVSGVGCGSNAYVTQAYLSYNPATVLNGGPYTVTATAIDDKCSNSRTSTFAIPFSVPSLPTYSGVVTCGTNGTLRVTFSKPVWCGSIALADFSATGGLTLTGVTPVNCTGSPTSTTTVDIAFNTPATSGSYTISLSGTVLSADCTPGYPLNTGNILTFNYLANPSISGSASSICAGIGTNVTLTLAGLPPAGATVVWTPSGGTVGGAPFGQTYVVTPSTTTTYTATVTYASCVKTATYTVTAVPAPVVSVTPQNVAICAASVPVTASATIAGGPCTGCSYAWSASPAEGGFPQSGVGLTSVTGTPGHTYTVIVTSPTGCASTPIATNISSATAPPPIPTCNVLFVSPAGGGTGYAANSPTTLTNALSIAGTNNVLIKMAVGLYTLNDYVTVSCNNELEGGYNSTFTNKNSDMSGGANTTVIRRNSTVDTGSDPSGGTAPRVTAIVFPAGSAGQRLQDIRIEVSNAAANSRITNYGVYVGSGCSNYDIVRCYIASGNAGSGVSGTNGVAGAAGNGGTAGGGCGNGCSGTQGNAGSGGNGAGGAAGAVGNAYGCGASAAGGVGTAATGRNGGGGGAGGQGHNGSGCAAAGGNGGNGGGGTGGTTAGNAGCNSGCGNGNDGVNGANGNNGANGTDGVNGSAGTATSGYWVPGSIGTVGGQNGTGGGGGEGGGGGGGDYLSVFCSLEGTGAGGGGGGGGGQGGTFAPTAGSGGGASYCVFAFNNGSGANVIDCQLVNGTLGAGGVGGIGGAGGTGGAGGNGPGGCGSGEGGGGDGGNGGNGGRGSHSGAGANGETFTVRVQGGMAMATNTSLTLTSQPVITVTGNGCANQNFSHATGASSPNWTNFGAGSSPASGAGSPVVTQYASVGRKTVNLNTGTAQVCGTWTDGFETATGWAFTAGGGVANRGIPYATNCSGTCLTGGARTGSNVLNLANCGHGITTYATKTLNLCSPGTFSGYFKTGSEGGWDYLVYSIDGAPIRTAQQIGSGCNNTWTAFNFPVGAGSHTIYLAYMTDGSVTSNGGKVWIDDVQCTNVELTPGTLSSYTYTEFNNVLIPSPTLPSIVPSATNACPSTLNFTTTVGSTLGYSFVWSAPTVSGMTPVISNTTAASPTITFPNTTGAAITFTVNCQITSACCGVLGTATQNIVINPTPAMPTAANVATCTGGTATLTATAPAGVTFYWWDAAAGGTLLGTGPSLNIASCPGGVTNYYVESENAQGCVSARQLVTLTGTTLAAPTAGAFTTPCTGGTTTLSASCPTCPVGTIFSWWDAAAAGSTYGNGSSIVTISITSATTYYIQANSPNGCVSPRTPVLVTPTPVTPPTASGFSRCGAGNVDLFVDPVVGATSYNWYTVPVAGVAVQSNLSLQYSTSIVGTTNFYVSVTIAGCSESARTMVTATMLPPQATVYWTGNVSTDWFNANNWYPVGCLPDCGINVDIQANRPIAAGGGACPNQPTIPSNPTDAECQNITIGAGANLTFGAPDSYLGVCGHWTQAGTLTMTQGTVEFQGTANQNYTRTGTGDFYNVIINNTPALTVTLINNMTLINGGTLTFASGRIITNANEVYVMNGALGAILGHNVNSYVQGNLRRNITQTGAYELPVGLDPGTKGYQLAIIDFSNRGSIGQLRAFFSVYGSLPAALNLSDCGTTFNCVPFDNGKWTIDAFNAGGVSITGNDATYSPTLYPRVVSNICVGTTAFTVMKQPTGAAGLWNFYGTCDPTSTSTRVTRFNIANGFSEFGVEQSTNPLPVEQLNLTANPVDNKLIAVKWTTGREFENAGFDLERSTDAYQFNKITWVDGNGTTQTPQSYAFDDKDVMPNVLYYYRLKQVDINGGFKYSNVVSAMILADELSVKLYPNPTNNQLNIDFFSPDDDVLYVKVFNALGQELSSEKFVANKGLQTFVLDMSSLADGTYTVVLNNSVKTINQKVVKLR